MNVTLFADLTILGIASYLVYLTLAGLSVFALGTGIFKLLQFSRAGLGGREEAERILDAWLSGRVDDAIKRAGQRKLVLSRVLHAVFSGLQARPNDPSYAEELSRQTVLIELARLSERMRSLDMVVQAAPMLGLLGTVVGMIDAFSVLAVTEGTVDPSALAGGIYVALTTTAAGLSIALLAFFIATWLESRIDRERTVMEALVSAAIHGRVGPSNLAA
ncbi:flagellar motor protein [Tritonibacter multivorans]|uniref:Flagellar motor protein n=1 Tax=Tritonibacter multivorans TaxID=928856 RepID=A0A0P1G9H3_9RHOB|nr:MotA/TolQ/ExbB proton channel family protein [Tritonibacter multivorans]MDA7422941.1 MotA/TolQ/ExbB proton channel family protein [Tritonibacter multivorans]CUH78142.1 flagellar motor protein [Tritonibacter multivorans]SFD74946.1 biopolymer transport protein ExbB [Tritonibacter multivorans]